MAGRDLSKVNDRDLVVHAIARLSFGALPIENWGCFFAPGAMVYPNDEVLANRAFSIWFPTIYDYIEGRAEFERVVAECRARRLDVAELERLANELDQRLRSVAGLLSREEQIFLRDRRLQNVHGSLEYFVAERPTVKWYDSASARMVVEQIDEAELHYVVLKPFNADVRTSQATLRKRVTSSIEWQNLYALWRVSLHRERLTQVIKAHGAAP